MNPTHSPVEYFLSQGWRVTSGYGPRKILIKGKWYDRFHHAVDFGGQKAGSPVRTPYGGVITARGTYGSRGKTVVVRIASGILQVTNHHDDYRVAVGAVVKPGDIIAINGMTGLATGPHVHYELRLDTGGALGMAVWGDPAKFYLPKENVDGRKTHVVASEETLGVLATRFKVSVKNLVDWNKAAYPTLASNPNLIRVGWELITSPPPKPGTTYVVVSGDSMYRIARAKKVTLAELIAANPQIANPGRIKPGDVLNIPATKPGVPSIAPVPKDYVVKRGDNLWKIARDNGYTVVELAAYNKISNPALIRAGQVIKFPPKG